MGAYLPLPHVYEREGRQERSWDIYSLIDIGLLGDPRYFFKDKLY